MASVKIRNLDEKSKDRLKKRAAANNRSMEEEARVILRDAVAEEESVPNDLVAFTRECFAGIEPFKLELPRHRLEEPPIFTFLEADADSRY
ncbi:MAG: plasmid stabilization protein [Gammaproteobacteria bacterium]|nr:plasmid stabilization protein [Gammaproteobacteria bacterium]